MTEEIVNVPITTISISKFTAAGRRSHCIPSKCKTCGAPALYKYFGVISCHSCKMFFKRNATAGSKALTCNYHGNCEINISNRHICTLCRLTKCFANGMQIEMIRCSRKTNVGKSRPKNRMITNEQNQLQLVPTLNLLRSDGSNLNTDQQNLLLNLTHCYEKYNILSHVQQFIQEQISLPIKLRFKIGSLDTFFGSILKGIELFFQLNNDFLSLCSHDRSILLRCAMENAGSFTVAFILRELPLFDYPDLTEFSENHFQLLLMNLTKYLSHEIDRDITFVKLAIAMFVFSTINCASHTNIGLDYLKNVKHILHIQDNYAEIAWRYLLYKYDHKQAVVCFTNFIKSLLVINSAIIEIHQSQQYKRMVENLIGKINQQVTVSA